MTEVDLCPVVRRHHYMPFYMKLPFLREEKIVRYNQPYRANHGAVPHSIHCCSHFRMIRCQPGDKLVQQLCCIFLPVVFAFCYFEASNLLISHTTPSSGDSHLNDLSNTCLCRCDNYLGNLSLEYIMVMNDYFRAGSRR